jgi:hypothetical protein
MRSTATFIRLALACLFLASGACGDADDPSGENISEQSQAQRAGGGGTTTRTCEDRYGDCYIGCSVSHPESADSPNNFNADLRQGCFDSCDAAYRTCRWAERKGGPREVPPSGGVKGR